MDEPLQSDLRGPRIVLCTGGTASAMTGETVRLPSGNVAFCPDADGPVTLTGEGTAFVVAPAQ